MVDYDTSLCGHLVHKLPSAFDESLFNKQEQTDKASYYYYSTSYYFYYIPSAYLENSISVLISQR